MPNRQLSLAKARVNYCQAELRRAEAAFDPCCPNELRSISKLRDDLAAAQKDCAWFALQVEDAEASAKVVNGYRARNGQ